MAFMYRNIYIQEEIFNWKRNVIYFSVSRGGGRVRERERERETVSCHKG